MKILAVANQKGGVGKSTLSVHLAYAGLEAGLRVLVVDLDKQGSLSLTFAPGADAVPGVTASQLFAAVPVEAKPEQLTDTLAIIRADAALLSVDRADNAVIRRPAAALRRLAGDYDLCVIDTPPLLGVRLMAGLTAADAVVTPVSVGLYELAGVADLMETLRVVKTQGFNPRLRHIGILPMKTNNRAEEEVEALAALRKQYGGVILAESLPERAAVRKAIALRRPVWKGTKGGGHLLAGREWRVACDAILGRMTA
jgi:chromosome partitioning protein